MAIFAKRLLKEMLSQNAQLMSEGYLEKQVKALNSGGIASLSAEWEIVILNAFNKIGHVEYEKSFGGQRVPDLLFNPTGGSNLSFLADIKTVSDIGYEDESPLNAFLSEAFRIFRKNKIRLNSLHYEPGDTKGSRGVKLKIPPKSQFNDFFKGSEFQKFISAIKAEPSMQHHFIFTSEEIHVRFYYDSQKKYGSGHYASYNNAHSLTKNPLYNALKDKTDQLKKSGHDGIHATFICDGGCRLLSNSMRDSRSYGLADIIKEFFRQHSSIDFILVFSVKDELNSFLNVGQKRYIEIRPFLNPSSKVSPEELVYIIEGIRHYLPPPVSTARNAFNKVEKGPEVFGNSFYGGYRVEGNTIKISSRGLLELLAGRNELKQFLQDHGQAPTDTHPANQNYFALRFNEGRLIENVRIEKSADRDDDWIVFELGNPDPAISKYRISKDRNQGVEQLNVP